MEGYFPLRLKRKDLVDFSDDFSDFSLTSPARKIRRLDADLPPIIEEEEPDFPIAFEDSLRIEQKFGRNSTSGIKIEELPDEPVNEERAIVLFNPNNTTPLLQTPSNFSLSINPSFVSGLKNQVLWSNESNSWNLTNEETVEDDKSAQGNGCRAVVPWVPSHFSSAPESGLTSQTDDPEMMDAQEMEEAATMEVEDPTTINNSIDQSTESSGVNLNDQFHQWQQQQQHCLIPQPPHNTATPIVWFR